MKERPILFNGAMVRAVLDGRKTQTRRVVKPQPTGNVVTLKASDGLTFLHDYDGSSGNELKCPYGQPGDQLWVREAFDPIYPQDPKYNSGEPIAIDYRADNKRNRLCDQNGTRRWTPSIHMRRSASRILLEVTGVRAERLQDIRDGDARAEGVDVRPGREYEYGASRTSFFLLWNSINGDGAHGWHANPWVWVLEFKRVTTETKP